MFKLLRPSTRTKTDLGVLTKFEAPLARQRLSRLCEWLRAGEARRSESLRLRKGKYACGWLLARHLCTHSHPGFARFLVRNWVGPLP
jgi:hypothetical protein